MSDISPEAREAAEKELTDAIYREHGDGGSVEGFYVQQLLDRIAQQHAEEMAKVQKELADNQFEWCLDCNSPLSRCGPESPDGEPTLDCHVCQLRELIRAKEQEAQQWFDKLTAADAALADSCRDNDRLKAELERVTKLHEETFRQSVRGASSDEAKILRLRAMVETLRTSRAENVSSEEAGELRDILRTLVPSGRAFITSARELVASRDSLLRRVEELEAKLPKRLVIGTVSIDRSTGEILNPPTE